MSSRHPTLPLRYRRFLRPLPVVPRLPLSLPRRVLFDFSFLFDLSDLPCVKCLFLPSPFASLHLPSSPSPFSLPPKPPRRFLSPPPNLALFSGHLNKYSRIDCFRFPPKLLTKDLNGFNDEGRTAYVAHCIVPFPLPFFRLTFVFP